jgi:glutaredoxin
MYGAEWCGHCKQQKEMFGESFKYVNYVECPENQVLCEQMGITGYPTWIINGVHKEGAQSIEELSSLTGCPLS